MRTLHIFNFLKKIEEFIHIESGDHSHKIIIIRIESGSPLSRVTH